MRIATSSLLVAMVLLGWASDASSLMVFSASYAVIALLPWTFGRYQPLFDPFEPYFGLSLLFFLYSASTLQFVEQNQVSYYAESVSESTLALYRAACLLGQLGLAFGYLVAPKETWRGASATINGKKDTGIRILLGPALLLATLLIPFYIDRFAFFRAVSYADAAFETRLVQIADSAAGMKNVFLRDAPVLIILCASTLAIFDGQRSRWIRAGAALALATYIATNLLSGWRGQVILGILLPVMYYHYRVRKLPIAATLIGGVSTYLLVNALAVMRTSADIKVMFALLGESISTNGLALFGLANSGELATSSNLLTLIAGIHDGKTDFKLGGLFLSQFGAYVPRMLWPGRPPMASELFVRTFYPGTLESGGGYGLFFHQEGYWDFGLVGVLINAAALGLLTRWIYVRLIVRRSGTVSIFMYTALYGALVLAVTRSGFVGSIKSALMASLPLLIIEGIRTKSRRTADDTDVIENLVEP